MAIISSQTLGFLWYIGLRHQSPILSFKGSFGITKYMSSSSRPCSRSVLFNSRSFSQSINFGGLLRYILGYFSDQTFRTSFHKNRAEKKLKIASVMVHVNTSYNRQKSSIRITQVQTQIDQRFERLLSVN